MSKIFITITCLFIAVSAQARDDSNRRINFNELIDSAKASQSEAEEKYGVTKKVDPRGPTEVENEGAPLVIPGETIYSTTVISIGAGSREASTSLSLEDPLLQEVVVADSPKGKDKKAKKSKTSKGKKASSNDPYPELQSTKDLEEASDEEVLALIEGQNDTRSTASIETPTNTPNNGPNEEDKKLESP